MNPYSFIPHRLFVAALSGGSKSPAPLPGRPVRVVVESDSAVAGEPTEARREEVASPIVRRVLPLGTVITL